MPPRDLEAPVDEQFPARWSPRAFAPDALSEEEVRTLFEAARWAPSCFNEQPWLFVWGTRPEDRERILGLLVEGNRVWAVQAPLLGVVFARRRFARSGNDNRWAAFDCGAAALSLALQASRMGLAAHFMGGFDPDAAHVVLGPPESDWIAMAAFAVGRPGDPSALPEALRQREQPSGRKPLGEVQTEGVWTGEKEDQR